MLCHADDVGLILIRGIWKETFYIDHLMKNTANRKFPVWDISQKSIIQFPAWNKNEFCFGCCYKIFHIGQQLQYILFSEPGHCAACKTNSRTIEISHFFFLIIYIGVRLRVYLIQFIKNNNELRPIKEKHIFYFVQNIN